MGTLKPGATYIYERVAGTIFAREAGADPSTRRVIGYESGLDYDPITGHRIQHDAVWQEWQEIILLAETTPALQDAVERVRMLYKLIKVDE